MTRRPGSIRTKSGRPAIFRVPNFLFEARGRYLGGTDPRIQRLNFWRSVIGFVMLIGFAITFEDFAEPVKIKVPAGQTPPPIADSWGRYGDTVYTLPKADQWLGDWGLSAVETLVASGFVVVAVAIGLVLFARSGYRLRTLRQFGWPLLAIAALAALFGLVDLVFGVLDPHLPGVIVFCLNLVLTVWLFKSLYFVATDMFRADDGHPLLAQISAPLVAWAFATITLLQGGPTGVPHTIGLAMVVSGPISMTLISVYAVRRLARMHPDIFPFRTGPRVARSQ